MSEYTREKLVESMRWQASQVRGGYIHGNVNAETAKRMEAAADMLEQDGADIETCMEALETLSTHGTIGAAVLSNLCAAGRNEMELRREVADAARKKTCTWKQADKDTDRHDSEARP